MHSCGSCLHCNLVVHILILTGHEFLDDGRGRMCPKFELHSKIHQKSHKIGYAFKYRNGLVQNVCMKEGKVVLIIHTSHLLHDVSN